MHMANELLSIPVAAGTLAIAAGVLGYVCKRARRVISSDRLAIMGIMGAFVFAAQMINFQLPVMPGTSGHMVGAVLLAIMLGPCAAAIVISSVVIIQCLIFQDGGLLALGCNIINMALVPSFLGYLLYRTAAAGSPGSIRLSVSAMLACIFAVEAGAVLVSVQAALSGVLLVPFSTFLITMLGVHLLVGFMEGLITVAVLAYIQQTRSDLILDSVPGRIRLSKTAVLVTLLVFTLITGAGLSLLACGLPDGLEWSYAERPDQPGFEPAVSNEAHTIAAVDDFQSRYSLLPDYSVRTAGLGEAAAGWTSFAGVVGSVLTMALVWLAAHLLRRKQPAES